MAREGRGDSLGPAPSHPRTPPHPPPWGHGRSGTEAVPGTFPHGAGSLPIWDPSLLPPPPWQVHPDTCSMRAMPGSLILPPLCCVASSNALPLWTFISQKGICNPVPMSMVRHTHFHIQHAFACLSPDLRACITNPCMHNTLYSYRPSFLPPVSIQGLHTNVCIAPRSSPGHPWDSSLTLTFLPSPQQTIEFDGSAGAVLRIQPLRTPRDENVYECVAQNSVGEITVHAKLTVLRGIGFPRVCGGGPQAWFGGQIPKGSMKVLLWIFTCGGL